jgi:hypothetical protein
MGERFARAGTAIVLADIEQAALDQAEREMRASGASRETAVNLLADSVRYRKQPDQIQPSNLAAPSRNVCGSVRRLKMRNASLSKS